MSFSRGVQLHQHLQTTSVTNDYLSHQYQFSSLPAFLLVTSIVTDWGYSNIKANGECLTSWAANNNLSFLLNPKGNLIFHLGRWKYETNLDLTFVKTETT